MAPRFGNKQGGALDMEPLDEAGVIVTRLRATNAVVPPFHWFKTGQLPPTWSSTVQPLGCRELTSQIELKLTLSEVHRY
jgi:hypothetical protein